MNEVMCYRAKELLKECRMVRKELRTLWRLD